MSRYGSLRTWTAGLALALSLGSAAAQETTTEAMAPGVGDRAPDFRLIGSDGNYYTLGQFKGKQPVVIAFFPKAFTGG
jgi:peroxiredoxin Q/BCP